MRAYVLAKDENGLRALVAHRLEAVDVAEADRKRISERGCETALVLGSSLQDVMRSFPAWFEEAA